MKLKLLVMFVLFLIVIPVFAELQPGRLWINNVEIPYERPEELEKALAKAAVVSCEGVGSKAGYYITEDLGDGKCKTTFTLNTDSGIDTKITTDCTYCDLLASSDSLVLGQTYNRDWSYGLFKFNDINILPAKSQLIEVKLKFNVYNYKPGSYYVRIPKHEWTADILWDTFKHEYAVETGSPTITTTGEYKEGWFTFILNNNAKFYLMNVINGKEKNTGFQVTSPSTRSSYWGNHFHTSESNTKPQLEITYKLKKECAQDKFERYFAEWKPEYDNCYAPNNDCSGTTKDNEIDNACCDNEDECVFNEKCYPITTLMDISSALDDDYDESSDEEMCASFTPDRTKIAAFWIDADVGDSNRVYGRPGQWCEQKFENGEYIDSGYTWIDSGVKCEQAQRWGDSALDYCDDTAKGLIGEGIDSNYCCGDDDKEYYITTDSRTACCSDSNYIVDENGNCFNPELILLKQAIEDENKDKCTSIETSVIKDTCYSSYATHYSDLSACNEVSENKEFCRNKASLFKATPCGDSQSDPGEECDEGVNNNDYGICNTQCKKTYCGDNKKQTPNGYGVNEECEQDSDCGVNNACIGCVCKDATIISPNWITFDSSVNLNEVGCPTYNNDPVDFDLDSNGNIHLTYMKAKKGYPKIEQITPSGKCVAEYGEDYLYSKQIGIGGKWDYKFVITGASYDTRYIWRYKGDNSNTGMFIDATLGSDGILESPMRISVVIFNEKDILFISGRTNKYAGYNGYIYVFEGDGTFLGNYHNQDFLFEAIIYNNKIRLYGIDTNGNLGRISSYDESESFTLLGNDAVGLSGSSLAINPSNLDIYVVESSMNRIRIFDVNGNQKAIIGAGVDGSIAGSQNGQFDNPTVVVIKNNYLYVLDKENDRIQKFKINPR